MNASPRWLRLAWCAAALCLLVLVTLTHMPMEPAPPGTPMYDTYEHLTAYAGLGGTFTLAGLLTWPKKRFRVLVIVFVVGIVFAGLDELTQPLTGRTADWRDWRSDIFGLLIGGGAAMLAVKLFRGEGVPPSPPAAGHG